MENQSLISQVAALRANAVAPRSRTAYIGSNIQMLLWFLDNKPDLLTEQFKSKFIVDLDNREKRKIIVDVLKNAPLNPPLLFGDIKPIDLLTWIVSLKKKDGSDLGNSSYALHRSAVSNMYRDFRVNMNEKDVQEIGIHYRGLKRKVASDNMTQGRRTHSGKIPLTFDLFKFLAKRMLELNDREFVFARCFMILSWNLMARSSNVVHIAFEHIEWREDALCIYFAQMKNDQMGEKTRDPRHVYANPIIPHICPILALALYLAEFPTQLNETRLFPGSNQYERYRKAMQRLTADPIVQEELRRRGVDPSDIGTHSLRKGAATFCSSGYTACPPSAAIHLRAGWSLGPVQNTYVRYEGAGDMYVGRTVAGLPAGKTSFATLPPHFGRSKVTIESTKRVLFSGIPRNLSFVAEFCLASVVYHADWLKDQAGDSYRIFQSALFVDTAALVEMSNLVICGLPRDDDGLQATGIPPHIDIRADTLAIRQEIKSIVPHIDLSRQLTVEGVTQVLEDRAIGAGTVTFDGLRNMLRSVVGECNGPPRATDTNQTESQNAINTGPGIWHHYGGRFHRVPQNFELPNGSAEQLWIHWCCGNATLQFAPLKNLAPMDLDDRNLRKRLSDARFLMMKIESKAQELELNLNNINAGDAAAVFDQCKEVLNIPNSTSQGRDRRTGQLKWTTIVKHFRNQSNS